jgi:predicted lactoylglutathione lyase
MKQIFINLPVDNLEVSERFYLALGFTSNSLFTGESQVSMTWSESIHVMLQTRTFSNTHLSKTPIDPRKSQIPTCTLPVENRDLVDKMLAQGIQAGGVEPIPLLQEEFMYLRSIEDPDGYLWGIMYLDVDRFKSITGN